jgi:hypothetical protein
MCASPTGGPPLIGVVDSNRAYFGLKDLSLLFDVFVTDSVDTYIGSSYSKRRYLNDLEWLLDNGLLRQHGQALHSLEVFDSPIHREVGPQLQELSEQNRVAMEKAELTSDEATGMLLRGQKMADLIVRMIANDLQISLKQNAQPVVEQMLETSPSSTSTAVVRIMMESLPIPNALNSWDDILAFKRDGETAHKLWSLKRWMSKLAKGGTDEAALRDEIEYTIQDYTHYLERAGLKTQHGAVETILVSTAEVLEDLVKLRWSKTLKSILGVRRANVELLELEAKAPGRECAYIVSARKQFPGAS